MDLNFLTLDDLDSLEIDSLELSELETLMRRLEELHDETDALEPDDEDPESDEYTAWLDDLELVDDWIDDVRDRLDALREP